MNKKLLITITALFYGFGLFSQATGSRTVGVAENNFRVASFIHEISKKSTTMAEASKLNLSNIEGSMYYTEDFAQGKIFYKEKVFNSVPMRYNAYSDEVEIKRDDQPTVEAVLKDSKVLCEVNGEKLIYSEYSNKKGDLEKSYLVQLFSGKKYRLYERRSKIFKEGQKPKTSFHIPTPDKFVDKSQFFVSIDKKLPEYFPTSKKGLATFFGADKGAALKSFIKKSNIDLDNKEDLERLVVYAETL